MPCRSAELPASRTAAQPRNRAILPEASEKYTSRLVPVVENSPATSAGVQAGDLITVIDGRSAAQWTLAEIQRLFQTPDREHTLEHDGRTRTVVLKTRALI